MHPVLWRYCTLYTLHSTLYTLHTTHCTHYTLYTLHSKHSTHYTLHSLHSTLYTLYTLHSTHYTLNTLHTLHSTLYTLHSTHSTHYKVTDVLEKCKSAGVPGSLETDFALLVSTLDSYLTYNSMCPPIAGTVPDLTSTTDAYVTLQTVYQNKAATDLTAFKKLLNEKLLNEKLATRSLSNVPMKNVKNFTHN